MSKRANPAIVGAFVTGAAVLAVVLILLLGGGRLWNETFECVAYFDESISGLDVGAPVDFQGVRIGIVSDVRIEFEMEQAATFFRPVTLQLDKRHLTQGGPFLGKLSPADFMEQLAQQGLRARLGPQSLLTGKLKIELGFFPHTPLLRKNREGDPWELPTIPSPFQQLVSEVSQLPLTHIVHEAGRVVEHLAALLDPDTAGETLLALNRALARFDELMSAASHSLEPLGEQAGGVMQSARTLLDELHITLGQLDQRLDPVLENLDGLSGELRSVLDARSPLREEMAALIYDVRQTTRSLRLLTEYLEQHPESILRGKRPEAP